MKVLVSADMEGATGVTWLEDVRPGAPSGSVAAACSPAT
jgi:D-amino peptidase